MTGQAGEPGEVVDLVARERLRHLQEKLDEHTRLSGEASGRLAGQLSDLDDKIEKGFRELHGRISEVRRFRERVMVGLILLLISACGYLLKLTIWG